MKITSKKINGENVLYPLFEVGQKVFCCEGTGLVHTVENDGFDILVWWDNIELNENKRALDVSYISKNGEIVNEFELLNNKLYLDLEDMYKLKEKILELYFNGEDEK